ncbi:MAG: hypothetical protein P4L71_09485 [Acetobacteraceae bacterium]|nr:hypothetical protein [Acetobacteraceae bacterium]
MFPVSGSTSATVSLGEGVGWHPEYALDALWVANADLDVRFFEERGIGINGWTFDEGTLYAVNMHPTSVVDCPCRVQYSTIEMFSKTIFMIFRQFP